MKIRAKSHGIESWRLVMWTQLETGQYLAYANHDFRSRKKDVLFLALIDDLYKTKSWSKESLIASLKSEQRRFCRVLEWLGKGAPIEVDRTRPRSLDEAITLSSRKWSLDPRVKFLELHGVRHSRLRLKPAYFNSTPVACWGLSFALGWPKDPVDLFVWELIRLYVSGDLRISRCKYSKCRRFFEPKTRRKVYCGDRCRALSHKKSPAEWREYMKRYRGIKRQLESRRQIGGSN